jgi:hypothetical protein
LQKQNPRPKNDSNIQVLFALPSCIGECSSVDERFRSKLSCFLFVVVIVEGMYFLSFLGRDLVGSYRVIIG